MVGAWALSVCRVPLGVAPQRASVPSLRATRPANATIGPWGRVRTVRWATLRVHFAEPPSCSRCRASDEETAASDPPGPSPPWKSSSALTPVLRLPLSLPSVPLACRLLPLTAAYLPLTCRSGRPQIERETGARTAPLPQTSSGKEPTPSSSRPPLSPFPALTIL